MNAITWTVEQLERLTLIDTLYTDSDPGTFVDLELLSLPELKSLFDVMFGDDVA